MSDSRIESFMELMSIISLMLFITCCGGLIFWNYRNNKPLFNFEEQCREVHNTKKFYKTYCSCLTKYTINEVNNGKNFIFYIPLSDLEKNENLSRKDKLAKFQLIERLGKNDSQCKFDASISSWIKGVLQK